MKKDFFYIYKTPLLVIAVLILFGGVFSLIKIKTSLFPQVTFPKIKVIAEAGQQSVDLMAVSVTRPLILLPRAISIVRRRMESWPTAQVVAMKLLPKEE